MLSLLPIVFVGQREDVTFCIESEDVLFEFIFGLGPDYFPLLRHVRWDCLIGSLPPAFETVACIGPADALWAGISGLVRKVLPLTGFASLIVADFPALFAEFGWKRFALLWRGSRAGFRARDFHRHCDGRAATLTLIQDMEGNIFGGFTPLKWESRKWNGKHGRESNGYKADPSLKTFLFTLKNPHNFPARRFALKAEKKDKALNCDSSWVPFLSDMGV
jgi:hypothetical protein